MYVCTYVCMYVYPEKLNESHVTHAHDRDRFANELQVRRSSDETTSKWQVLKKKEGKGKDEKLNKRESFDDSWRTDRRAR